MVCVLLVLLVPMKKVTDNAQAWRQNGTIRGWKHGILKLSGTCLYFGSSLDTLFLLLPGRNINIPFFETNLSTFLIAKSVIYSSVGVSRNSWHIIYPLGIIDRASHVGSTAFRVWKSQPTSTLVDLRYIIWSNFEVNRIIFRGPMGSGCLEKILWYYMLYNLYAKW